MESGETFTDDEIEPSEHDYGLKICVQYFYLGSNRKKVYHFAWALILDKDCISAKFCMQCIYLKVIRPIMICVCKNIYCY